MTYESSEREDGGHDSPDPVDVGHDIGRVEPHPGRDDVMELHQATVLVHVGPEDKQALANKV